MDFGLSSTAALPLQLAEKLNPIGTEAEHSMRIVIRLRRLFPYRIVEESRFSLGNRSSPGLG